MILDAGSGSNPFPQADILVDAYIKTSPHRRGRLLVLDHRPFICASISQLPFRDKVFKLVYCHHVIEHTKNPHITLNELRRVSEHGYVSFPSRIAELFMPQWKMHRWAVSKVGTGISMEKPFTQALRNILLYFWKRDYRIRLRAKIKQIFRGRFLETIIHW